MGRFKTKMDVLREWNGAKDVFDLKGKRPI